MTSSDDTNVTAMAVEPSDNASGNGSSSSSNGNCSSSSNTDGQVQQDSNNDTDGSSDDVLKTSKAILTGVADTVQFKNELLVVQELLEKNTLLTGMIGAMQGQGQGSSSTGRIREENIYMASLYLNELQANLCEVDRLYTEMGLREKK